VRLFSGFWLTLILSSMTPVTSVGAWNTYLCDNSATQSVYGAVNGGFYIVQPFAQTVTQVGFYCGAVTTNTVPATLTIHQGSIGTPIASVPFTPVETSWNTVNISASLTKGTPYWYVITTQSQGTTIALPRNNNTARSPNMSGPTIARPR
jgi:hypothetical protein